MAIIITGIYSSRSMLTVSETEKLTIHLSGSVSFKEITSEVKSRNLTILESSKKYMFHGIILNNKTC